MAFRKPQPKKPRECAVELAIAALDGNPNPLNMAMEGLDPAPTSLDLPATREAGECSDPGRSRPAVDECIICDQSPCEDCD